MTIEVEIDNIAGIKAGSATIEPGTNAVTASNWQGKTSFLTAVQVGMGTATSLTEGEQDGRVRLSIADETYTVRVTRETAGLVQNGTPYLAAEYDRIRADLFAFLDEANEIRTAVRDGRNLESLLTRPLAFEDIDVRIRQLQDEREQVDRELERAVDAAEELPTVIERIDEHEAQLDRLREQKAAVDDPTSAAVEKKRDELSEARAKRDRLDNRIERLEESIERATDRLAETRTELSDLDVPDEDELETQLADERSRLSAIERDLELLRSVYEANTRVLDEDRTGLLTDVNHSVHDDAITCWICGGDGDRETFENRLDALRERIADFESEARTHRETVEDLETRREEIAATQRRKRSLEREIADIEQRIIDREESLNAARDDYTAIDARIEALETDVEAMDEHLTDIESQRKYVERELEDLRDRRSKLDSRASQREQLDDEREELTDEIEALRTRKESVRQELRERFDAAIDEVVPQFETGFETARLTASFDLVIARDGREASIDALSEGERELLGIVVALAGYLTFDVADDVPVFLLDGLGGLADENLQRLVEFLAPYPDYLLVTAYPEYAPFDGQQIDPTEWTVVSRDLADG